MKIIVCADKQGGMLFAGRRTSRDKVMLQNMIDMLGGRKLFISPFSEKLLSPYQFDKHISASFLDEAGEDDICFVENVPLLKYLDKINTLIIYRWDKEYPFDFQLDLKPFDVGFKIDDVVELKGFSHEIIDKEVYVK